MIAKVGSDRQRSATPQLHFELRQGAQPIDPRSDSPASTGGGCEAPRL